MVSESRSINLHNSALQLMQPTAMPNSEKLALKKLKIKLSRVRSDTETVQAECQKSSLVYNSVVEKVSLKTSQNNCSGSDTGRSPSYGFNRQVSLNSESGHITTSGKETRTTNKNKLGKNTRDHLVHEEMIDVDKSNVKSSATHATKRGPVQSLDGQKAKKQKIDSKVMQQCASVLNKLMSQPFSFVFNQPVDPVKLNIPDYFSIISEPMDLGTIKSKLGKKLYSNTEEFVDDVRLTFSNAMLYNPPSNDVHVVARNLKGIFESRWKSLEAKWSAKSLKEGQQLISNNRVTETLDLRPDGHKTRASCNKLPTRMSMVSLQKQKLKKVIVEISKRKIPPPLLDHFQKFGLIGHHEERIEADIDAFDEFTVCELHKVIRNYLQLRPAESAHTQNSCGRDSLQKDLHKGTGNSSRQVCGSVNTKSQTNPVCMNGSCGSMDCRCSHNNDFTQASSDVDSDRSVRDNNDACHDGVHNLDLRVNDTASRQMSKSDPDSDGAVSAVDEENVQPSSHPATSVTAATSAEGWESNIYDGQLSPSKALRAAMLRSRFADTIVKAKQKTLLNHGEKSDPVKLKQEKERLERQQREEKAKIEAKIRAAEAASRMREEAVMKMQREKEREAARIALQKMKKTVEIYENLEILKDLEMLGGCCQPDYLIVHHGNPLERLGLFMKDEYLEDEEELENWNVDVEEGEIAS